MIGLIPLFAAGFLVLVLVILIVWKLIKLMMVVLLLSILLLILWYFGPLEDLIFSLGPIFSI